MEVESGLFEIIEDLTTEIVFMKLGKLLPLTLNQTKIEDDHIFSSICLQNYSSLIDF